MDRSFIIPIAVAAGVHSMLFISGTEHREPPPPPAKPADSILRELVLPPLEPDVVESDEPMEKATEAPPPPRSIGLPSPSFSADDITQIFDPLDMLPRPDGPVADTISSDWRKAVASAANSRGGPISWISLDNTPAARFQPAPAYPQDLKFSGDRGSATVVFSVDVNGSVFNAEVTRSSHSRFGEEALRAVKRWRFEPGLKDGKRVAFRMVQTFTFTLSE